MLYPWTFNNSIQPWYHDSSVGKEFACNAGDPSSIPGLGRSAGEGIGHSLQYSGLENSMDYLVHGVTNSHDWATFSFMVPKCLPVLRHGIPCAFSHFLSLENCSPQRTEEQQSREQGRKGNFKKATVTHSFEWVWDKDGVGHWTGQFAQVQRSVLQFSLFQKILIYKDYLANSWWPKLWFFILDVT